MPVGVWNWGNYIAFTSVYQRGFMESVTRKLNLDWRAYGVVDHNTESMRQNVALS